jgi:hypothetical protein
MVVGPQKNDAGYWTFWKSKAKRKYFAQVNSSVSMNLRARTLIRGELAFEADSGGSVDGCSHSAWHSCHLGSAWSQCNSDH